MFYFPRCGCNARWRHSRETVWGTHWIHRSPVNSPLTQRVNKTGLWCFSFVNPNKLVHKQLIAGDMRHHDAHMTSLCWRIWRHKFVKNYHKLFWAKFANFELMIWMLYHHDPITVDTQLCAHHYSDVIMDTIASQITSLTIVYSTVYSDADQRKHQSSAALAFVRGIHWDRWIPRTNGQ